MIEIQLLSQENMNRNSLDDYCRTQNVSRVYRLINGEYQLIKDEDTMDWSLEKKRSIAKELLSNKYISYGAIDEGKIIGFISLESQLRGERLVLDMMQVSRNYRGQGLGKKLFQIAKVKAKEVGAKQLYISAFSSKETIAFYKAMGCKVTDSPIESIAKSEPMDLQMIYDVEC